ncbi:hypothetical protein Nepgr_032295 [Nepenthes gracilis]|uniref:Uncharacterized protein n=1 Tax=Nepenthes gracilis TaxID=150966 RepID=A0AAD3TKJ8_NEPGR|nr:hypothetical protein Nepgr_032295 [Nepenthes gracilis]
MEKLDVARICVEIDADAALPSRIILQSFDSNPKVNVEYSWKPIRCGQCLLLGHKEPICKAKRTRPFAGKSPRKRALPKSRPLPSTCSGGLHKEVKCAPLLSDCLPDTVKVHEVKDLVVPCPLYDEQIGAEDLEEAPASRPPATAAVSSSLDDAGCVVNSLVGKHPNVASGEPLIGWTDPGLEPRVALMVCEGAALSDSPLLPIFNPISPNQWLVWGCVLRRRPLLPTFLFRPLPTLFRWSRLDATLINLADPNPVDGVFVGGSICSPSHNVASDCLDHSCCRAGTTLTSADPPTGLLNNSAALEPESGLGLLVFSRLPSPVNQPDPVGHHQVNAEPSQNSVSMVNSPDFASSDGSLDPQQAFGLLQ